MCRTAGGNGGNGGNGEKTVVVYIGCFYTYTIKCSRGAWWCAGVGVDGCSFVS